jgi:site-specific recombinase XerD
MTSTTTTTLDVQEQLRLFIQSRQAKNCAPRTIEWYESQVSYWTTWATARLAQDPTIDIFEPELFEEYMISETERASLGDGGRMARYVSCRAFFKWMFERERRRLKRIHQIPSWEPPTDFVDCPEQGDHQPRVADAADLDILQKSIGMRNWVAARDLCMIEMMRSCGLRIEEVCHAKVGHVDLAERFLFVRAGKGDKDRFVPFGNTFANSFIGYIYMRPPTCADTLFIECTPMHTTTNIPMNDNAARTMLRRRCRDAGIGYINPHSIRHYYAISSLNAGMKLDAVSATLGHSSTAFTARVYAKWVKTGLRREYDEAVNR